MAQQVQFAGSNFNGIGAAATAWAATALPDTSVIGAGEDAAVAASDLEAYWWGEAARIGEGAPDDVDADEWRAACRVKLSERIEASRAP